MKKRVAFTPGEMALVGMFAAVTAVFSQISIPMTPVPFSMGILAVMLCATILETRLAVAAQLVYVLLGAAGAPVFSGFQGGVQRLAGPTGGFLIAYIVMAFAMGMILSRSISPSFTVILIANITGIMICHSFGVLWLGFSTGMDIKQVFMAASAPFIPFDIVKAAIAAAVGQRLRARLKILMIPAK